MKRNKWMWAKVAMYSLVMGFAFTSCDDDDDDDNITPAAVVQSNLDTLRFSTTMTGAKEVPQVASSGIGNFEGDYDPTSRQLTYTVTWTLGNPNDQVTGMHFHGPADTTQSAPIVIPVDGFSPTSTGSLTATTRQLSAQEEADLRAGKMYFNVHSTTYPTGELRGNLR